MRMRAIVHKPISLPGYSKTWVHVFLIRLSLCLCGENILLGKQK